MNHLEDKFSLRLLRHLVSGDGVRVNINSLANKLKLHRTTVSKRVQLLFKHRILDKPRYPFLQLFHEYGLLVIALADIPRLPSSLLWLCLFLYAWRNPWTLYSRDLPWVFLPFLSSGPRVQASPLIQIAKQKLIWASQGLFLFQVCCLRRGS